MASHGCYCSVNGCKVNVRDNVPFFRCPKDSARCQQWKNVLGFIGEHKYAKVTPEVAHSRIRICSAHFEEQLFTSSGKRLLKTAVPSKLLPKLDDYNKQENEILVPSEVQFSLKSQMSTRTIINKKFVENKEESTSSELGTNNISTSVSGSFNIPSDSENGVGNKPWNTNSSCQASIKTYVGKQRFSGSDNYVLSVQQINISSQPSTSSSCGTPSADPFGGEEPSCSREEVPGVATTLQLLPEQTEEPFLGVVNKPRSYKKGSDKTYCRFCLQSSGKNTSTPLAVVDLNYPGKSDVFRKKKMEKVEEINKMLRFCLPFYDSLTFNPVICSICLGRLKVAYEFSKQCFKNQQLIEKYADTYSATERVINLNEMIETKFKLPDDGNMSESETFSDIPQVTRTSNRISQKRKYPNYNDPPLKKRKACSETYEDDSTNSSDNTSNIKIEPDDDDNSGLMESLKMELDDEDNSFGFTERTLDDVPQSYNISEEGIKVEPNYIDCPDFIKSEQVDDLHEEHKVFDERTGIGTDSERQQLYSQGLGNVSVATKNDPLFVKEPSFSTVGTGLEDSTDD